MWWDGMVWCSSAYYVLVFRGMLCDVWHWFVMGYGMLW